MVNDKYRISVTGDILCKKEMCDRAVKDNGFDFSESLNDIKPLFSDSDLVIGNLETPLSDDNDILVSERRSFCAPFEFAKAVYNAGIHCVSTANNHALDRGIEGLNETIRILDRIGFIHTGTFDSPEKHNTLIESGDMKLGFLSYTYGTNAHHNGVYLTESEEWRINLLQKQEFHNKLLRYIYSRSEDSFFFRRLDRLWCRLHPEYLGKAIGERRQPDSFELEAMDRDILSMKQDKPDLTLFSMHIGGQYNETPTAYAVETAKRLKSAGINIIIGNHEHRIQGTDLSSVDDGSFVMYCLGNLISTTGIIEKPMKKECDHSVICHIDIDIAQKTISRISYNIIRTILSSDGIIKSVPAFNLYNKAEGEERDSLSRGILTAVSRFSGKAEETEIKEEYLLYERQN